MILRASDPRPALLAFLSVLMLSPALSGAGDPFGGATAVESREKVVEQPAPLDTADTEGHWVAIPAIFSTPETGFGGGPAVGYIFPRGGARYPSSIFSTFFYTEREQILSVLAPEVYFPGGDRLYAVLSYQKFPDSFWGIGPGSRTENEEKYTPELFSALLVGQLEAAPGLRVGLQYIFRRETILEKEKGGALDSGTIAGSDGGIVSGAGVLLTLDTRDNLFGSRRGWFLQLSEVSYGSLTGSDYDFWSAELDARRFIEVMPAHVAAFRVFCRATGGGDVPFQDLPSLGGQGDMRGFQEGRYRDSFAAYAQAGYRFPLFWRVRGEVFGSAGSVSADISSFSAGEMKYAGGAGLRFVLNEERFAIRMDYAAGSGSSSGFYITTNEAF